MNPVRYIGTRPMRLSALLLLAACAASWRAHFDQAEDANLLFVSVVLSVLAFMAVVHSGKGIYERWMQIAERIQLIVVTTIFSALYLTLVPLLWIFAWSRDSMGLRNSDASSYWQPRRNEERDLEFFRRPG